MLNKARVSYIKFLLILCFILSFALFSLSLYLHLPLKINASYGLYILNGQSVTDISNNLVKDKIIKYPWLFKFTLILLNKDSKIQAGEYELSIQDNASLSDLINKITTGAVKRYSFRIHDGETIASIINRLKQEVKLKKILINDLLNPNSLAFKKIISDTSIFLKNNSVLNAAPASEPVSLDGLLSPDTYYYSFQDLDAKLVNIARLKLLNALKTIWEAGPYKKNSDPMYYKVISSPYRALILASILEKEAASSNERLLISGVIYNRLRLGMPLQVDPTVIYALSDKYNGNLTKADLSYNSPYNTYINKELPPGPIGTVSVSSIQAAINPLRNDYLYFVSKGDGTHHFSKTLEEHSMAVNYYQKIKK
ncbi:MAG: endolytic transglycosylase MltG [Gammaproteobacteria bacterium]|nr:endolytic transglycosylase MltG [Gammaproteobacteria bacterium]